MPACNSASSQQPSQGCQRRTPVYFSSLSAAWTAAAKCSTTLSASGAGSLEPWSGKSSARQWKLDLSTRACARSAPCAPSPGGTVGKCATRSGAYHGLVDHACRLAGRLLSITCRAPGMRGLARAPTVEAIGRQEQQHSPGLLWAAKVADCHGKAPLGLHLPPDGPLRRCGLAEHPAQPLPPSQNGTALVKLAMPSSLPAARLSALAVHLAPQAAWQ